MASRFKEDDKNERAIRSILKLQPNRRCINCNSLRARDIYFKEWDAQLHSFPDCSNVDRLRDFIKHVYVDRRFTGDKTSDKQPRVKGDKDDSYDNRRVEAYQGGYKSPPSEDTHERYGDRSSPRGRSPRYDQESREHGYYKRSPGRPPFINDWRCEDPRVSDGDYKVESQSPERARDLGSSSPPLVQPVRDILGENVVPLRISGPAKPNGGKLADGSALTQDLFTVKHSSFPAPVQGWQMGLPQGMGISMQYNNVPVPNFPQSSRSTNPFDASSKPSPDQAPSFPSMTSLQSVSVSPPLPTRTPSLCSPLYAWSPPLPPPSGTMYSSNLGYYAWNPPLPPPSGTADPSSLGIPSHTSTPQTHASALGPGSYMGQQMATNIPFPRKEVGNFGIEGNIFGLSNPDQQLTGRTSTTPTSNPFPNGGNPFG